MCSGKGIGHRITHSPITPLDSSAAGRFASVLLPQEPTIVSSAEFASHGDRAHLPSRSNLACATSPRSRTF
jgi:hypothetical protein